MKRAIFKGPNIEIAIANMVILTPISPATLPFAPGEEIVVAVPKSEAGQASEYQLVFTIAGYAGERPELGQKLFGRRDWKHSWELAAVRAIEPFSLDDVVSAAGERGPDVRYHYKGQTQHHRIIRTIRAEDEPLYRQLLVPSTDPTWSASSVLQKNQQRAEDRAAAALSAQEIERRLRAMSRRNAESGSGRSSGPGSTQRRNARFSALLRLWYDGACQVCGERIADPSGSKLAAQVHHLTPWAGSRSDRLDNAICVCPNHHAMFELGCLSWADGVLTEVVSGEAKARELALDKHLTIK